MKVFLAGVGCVGKTAIGACLAQRIGCAFFDLDLEIEKNFGRPIERLRAEARTPRSFRKRFASVVLKKLVEAGPDAGFVMALIDGLDVERSAIRIEHLLREREDGQQRGLSTMHLFEAIDAIREKATGMQVSGAGDLWSAILKQIRERQYFEHRCAETIEGIIRSLVDELDDVTAIAMWRETDTGIADDADDKELVADSLRMDLNVELLQAITNLAYDEAKGSGSA